ncbi:PTS sugar transporter subunit IIA [Leptotrichia sp. HSP-342]|uniref:PTS sugar transporter subunit IIA n=1 Tax=Leptotrichia mesophila TaxID=3239303 RepID=A0AB39VBV1_9FUSO
MEKIERKTIMININDLINENLIALDLDAKDKTEVLEKLADMIHREGRLNKAENEPKIGFLNALWERENSFSTAVGFSYGIPHGKCKYVKEASVAYARLKDEIKWADDENVKYVFMIAVPDQKAGNEHLEILIKLSTSILEDDFREKLEKVQTAKEALETIKKYSSKNR